MEDGAKSLNRYRIAGCNPAHVFLALVLLIRAGQTSLPPARQTRRETASLLLARCGSSFAFHWSFVEVELCSS